MSAITINDLQALENAISDTEKQLNGRIVKKALLKLKHLVSEHNFCSLKKSSHKVKSKVKNDRSK